MDIVGRQAISFKQATAKRRRDSASQSLSKTIVLGLEDYFLGAIAALNLT